MANSQIDNIIELDALADLMIEKGQEIKSICRKAKAKLEGVLTPSLNGKDLSKLAADAVAKRRARKHR
jgi:Spy/CpxP family protein refolding chaperone